MASDFHIRDVEAEKDRAAVRGLLTEGFDVQPGVGAAFARLYDVAPNALSRVAVMREGVVGHVLLASRTFWLAERRVPGGILAMVVVDSAHRGLGIGSALVRDAVVQARIRHLEWLHVAGDPRFYLRFGFIPAYLWAIAALDATSDGQEDGLRVATVEDIDLLAALSACEVSVGGVVPDAERWRWVLQTRHPASLLMRNDRMLGFRATEDACWLLDRAGFVRACWNAQTLAVYEAAAMDEAAGDRLLDAVRCQADALGCTGVKLFLAPNAHLIRTAERLGAQVDVRENGEQLARLLDIRRVLMRLAPVLSRRVRAVDWTGTLGLRIGGTCLKLEIDRSGVAIREANERTVQLADWIVTLPEIALTRALLGTDRLSERVGDQGDASLCAVLDALFPMQMPFFNLGDAL